MRTLTHRRGERWPRGSAERLAWSLLCVVTALGCSARRTPPTVAPAATPAAATEAGAPPLDASLETTAYLPADVLGTQRLYRADFDGPEGRAAVKLVLRLETPRRYDLAASDALGRPAWQLQARDGEGLLVDLLAQRACRVTSAAAVPGGLGFGLALEAIPRTLLGRLPVPAAPRSAAHELREAGGRRWTWTETPAGLEQWTLWEGGEPAVWWSRRGARSTLSIRARSTQLRWQESVVEPLGAPLAPLRTPDGVSEGACNGADVP